MALNVRLLLLRLVLGFGGVVYFGIVVLAFMSMPEAWADKWYGETIGIVLFIGLFAMQFCCAALLRGTGQMLRYGACLVTRDWDYAGRLAASLVRWGYGPLATFFRN